MIAKADLVIDNVTEIKREQREIKADQRLVQQKMDFSFDATKDDIAGIKVQITDHEGRIRMIERIPH